MWPKWSGFWKGKTEWLLENASVVVCTSREEINKKIMCTGYNRGRGGSGAQRWPVVVELALCLVDAGSSEFRPGRNGAAASRRMDARDKQRSRTTPAHDDLGAGGSGLCIFGSVPS